MLSEFSKPLIDAFHRSHSRCASIAANLPRQINQRNDNGKRTDDLADCTNRFPIHGMIHVIAPAIQSHCTIRRKDFWRLADSPEKFQSVPGYDASLKEALCSCVSITLPAASQTR